MATKSKTASQKSVTSLPINDLFQIDFWLGDFFVTRDRRMFGVIELDGYDADALGQDEHLKMAMLSDTVYSSLSDKVAVTQYYVSVTGSQVEIKDRDDEFSHSISKSREEFLRRSDVSEGRLYQFYEISLNEDLNSLGLMPLIKNIGRSATDPASREALKNMFSMKRSYLLSRKDINLKSKILSKALEDVLARWSMLINGRRMSRPEVWRVLKFFSTLQTKDLTAPLQEPPERDGGTYLCNGDIDVVQLGAVNALKHKGVSSRYSRMASLTRLGKEPLPGLWANDDKCPLRIAGNFIVMYRFERMSKIAESLFFSSSKRELERSSFDLTDLLTSNQNQDYMEKQAKMSKGLKDKFKELDEAKSHAVSWGHAQCSFLVFGDDYRTIDDSSQKIDDAVAHCKMSAVWESVGLPDAYKTFFPTGRKTKHRRLKTNSRQNAVASLFYKANEGQRYVSDLDGDEAQFIFETESGLPFYYSPFVGGRGLVIGVGPTRSGKTYLKNSVSAHALKSGGHLVDVDVDKGSETLALALGDEGAIFRVGDPEKTFAGFNLFSTYNKEDPADFKLHLKQQLLRMMKTNDEIMLQQLEEGEQAELDRFINAVLEFPVENHTLSHLVYQMPPGLKRKLQRWVRGDGRTAQDGDYAQLTDCKTDAAGGMTARHKVFNLQHVKDKADMKAIIYPEIIHRLNTIFEDPKMIGIPNVLNIDEFHHPAKDEQFVDDLMVMTRTVNKYMTNINLWTQAPGELFDLPQWDMLRSSASTFFFMADSAMDADVYKKTFKLTDGELEALRTLRPRQDAYIIQRDLNISKKVQLNNDPMLDLIATSKPKEVKLRNMYFERYGFELGMEKVLPLIAAMRKRDDEVEVESESDKKLKKEFYAA